MFNFLSKKTRMVEPSEALPGRSQPIATAPTHFVNGHPLKGPYPADAETAIFGLGCFWGAERKFWQAGEGVFVTAVGYAGGATPNPTYEETCSIRPRACARATMSARNIARRFLRPASRSSPPPAPPPRVTARL